MFKLFEASERNRQVHGADRDSTKALNFDDFFDVLDGLGGLDEARDDHGVIGILKHPREIDKSMGPIVSPPKPSTLTISSMFSMAWADSMRPVTIMASLAS